MRPGERLPAGPLAPVYYFASQMIRPALRPRPLLLCAGVLLAVALFAGTAPAPAFGHATFLGSSPQPGVRLETSPREIAMTFTEPLNAKLSRASLEHVDDGGEISLSVRSRSGRRMVAEPPENLKTGAYRVQWHSVSTQDGHSQQGSFSFGLRAAAAGDKHVVEQSAIARNGWVRILTRGLMYATLLLFAGVLLLRALLAGGRDASWLVPQTLRSVDGLTLNRVRARERSLMGDLGLIAAGVAILAIGAEAVDAAGGLSPVGLSDYLLSNVAGIGRLAVVVLVLVASWTSLRWPKAAAVPAALALGAVAVSGHAGSAISRLAAVAIDWAHLLAAAVWVGGIAVIALAWGPELRHGGVRGRLAVAREVLPVFGLIALPAFLLVAMTGLLSAVIQLRAPSALWMTAYGRVLALKLALVVVLAAASYMHAMRLRPRMLARGAADATPVDRRHWRLLGAEPVVGLVVVAIAAALVTFPLPPRQFLQADPADAAPPCDPCPLPKPAPDQLAVADLAGSTLVAAWIGRHATELRGELRLIDITGKPSSAPVKVLGGTQSRVGPGHWSFRVRDSATTLRVAVGAGSDRGVAGLPARWKPDANRRARRILERAQSTMRELRSFRETERATSGLGRVGIVEYRVRAPNRMAYATDGGAANVMIGRRSWMKAPGLDWQAATEALAFRSRTFFRWTPYAQAVRLLKVGTAGGRRTAELALMDAGTPVWHRLTVDLATGRVRRASFVVRGQLTHRRFYAINRPLSIQPPSASGNER